MSRFGRYTVRCLVEGFVAILAFVAGSQWARWQLNTATTTTTTLDTQQKREPSSTTLEPLFNGGMIPPIQPNATVQRLLFKRTSPCLNPATITTSTIFLNRNDNTTCLAILPQTNVPPMDLLLSLGRTKRGNSQSFAPIPWYTQNEPQVDSTTTTTTTTTRKKPWRLASPPKPILVQETWWPLLSRYLGIYDSAQRAFQAFFSRSETKTRLVDNNNNNNNNNNTTVVVLVTNQHHLPLLQNFACAARHAKFAPHQVVVVALDDTTYQWSIQESGFDTFFFAPLAALLSSNHNSTTTTTASSSTEYATREYGTVMLVAKVFVAHLLVTSKTRQHFLFQDVDVVPLRNDYVQAMVRYANNHNNNRAPSDLVFQYDFFLSQEMTPPEYAPWFLNSGFYWVRRNARTRHFWNDLLWHGDLVLKSNSHQAVVSWLVSQHASRHGLRVQVLDRPREADLFPGGYHFHHKWDYMRSMIAGTVRPYIFHMNYNDKSTTKRFFMEQLGLWFLTNGNDNLTCSAKLPPPVCHFRDKPSLVPCRDSQVIETGKSFW